MKRVLLVVIAIAAAACSKNESAPAPLPSSPTVSVDESSPTSLSDGPSGDACVDACVAKYKAGVAKFEALDVCVVGSCQPLEGAPSGGSCAAAAAVTYGYAATDACIRSACCAEATACANDSACTGMTACMNACNANATR